jgi:pilus assembly protein Flp/PilA
MWQAVWPTAFQPWPYKNVGAILSVSQRQDYNQTLLSSQKPLGKEVAMLFHPNAKGQGLVEYALILVLVAIVVIVVLLVLGPLIGNAFSTINSTL